ncbi:MAG: hypothetical protein OHK0056_30940 [Bacteriovoracaceae bacterium]
MGTTACSSSNKSRPSVADSENSNELFKKLVIDGRPTMAGPHSAFIDRSSEVGLDNVKATQIYAVDFNRDGYDDIVILPEHYSTPRFFENEKGKFKELSYSPFVQMIRAQALVFVDLNNDQIPDLIAYTLNQKTALNWEPIRVFQGKMKEKQYKLIEVSNAIKLDPEPTASIVPFDFDLDGQLDLFVGNWYDMRESPPKNRPDRLLKGEKFSFTDSSSQLKDEHQFDSDLKIFTNARPTMAASLCDLDQDGRVDILTSSSGGYFNKLWMDRSARGRSLFQDYAEQAGYAHDPDGVGPLSGGNSFYANCADYNNDGIMDIAVGELFHSYQSESVDRSSILTGESLDFPPRFIRSEYISDDGSGRWTQADRRGFFADLNNDGLLDLIVDNSGYPPKTRLVVFKQFEDHAYQDFAPEFGVDIMNPSGTVAIDFDRDGDLDLLVGQNTIRDSKIENKLYVFENTQKDLGNSITIKLHGKKANKSGLGAIVEVTQKSRTQKRVHQLWSGPLSSQLPDEMHFGLGNESVEKIVVLWPSYASAHEKSKNNLKIYTLNKLKLGKNQVLHLCESGKFSLGKNIC